MAQKSKLILLGFFTALVSAGTGIGGGAILVPFLVSVFGFDFKKAAGVSLATIIPITCVGAVSHFLVLSDTPELKYYLLFIPSCVAGTFLGAGIVGRRQNRLLKLAFSVFLLMISLKMLKIADAPALIFGGLHDILFLSHFLIIMAVGMLVGIIAVHLGIGCGLLIVPFYVLIIDFPIHQAVCLSLTTMFFLSLSATLIQKKLKRLDMASVRQLFAPALIGAFIGVMISSRLPADVLTKLFGLILFAIAWGYILNGIMVHGNPSTSVKNPY